MGILPADSDLGPSSSQIVKKYAEVRHSLPFAEVRNPENRCTKIAETTLSPYFILSERRSELEITDLTALLLRLKRKISTRLSATTADWRHGPCSVLPSAGGLQTSEEGWSSRSRVSGWTR